MEKLLPFEVATTNPCPSWCALPAGHTYDSEVDDHGRIFRSHSPQRLPEPVAIRGLGFVEAAADEYASAADRPGTVGQPYVAFELTGFDLAPDDARELARHILAAADQAEKLS